MLRLVIMLPACSAFTCLKKFFYKKNLIHLFTLRNLQQPDDDVAVNFINGGANHRLNSVQPESPRTPAAPDGAAPQWGL
ncbi:MAG: hypothetical protein D3914_12330, partial [Candidatus Electrothrix sp. LOE2]|nr:hypothetical protein [Candidatus Electrothrix sp. LOE2]